MKISAGIEASHNPLTAVFQPPIVLVEERRRSVGAPTHRILTGTRGLLPSGCAASETRSIVGKDDLPASTYKKVAVLIENLDEAEPSAAEQIVVAAPQRAGIDAIGGPDVPPPAPPLFLET